MDQDLLCVLVVTRVRGGEVTQGAVQEAFALRVGRLFRIKSVATAKCV